MPHVVVLGGGFAGLYAARSLSRASVRVTLVDRRNYHLFQPLLYQVATAALSAPDIAEPIRKVLRRQRNATVLLAEARAADPNGRRVLLDGGELTYDYLIVATGASHAYFGHEDWARHSPGLKTIEDAFEIRRRVLLSFEAAEFETDPACRGDLLTFIVIGAGPTGVELAGALREIAQHTLAREFRNFDPRTTRIVVLEAADRLLSSFPEECSHAARRLLEKRGVQVRTGARVTGVDSEGVWIGAERICARTVLWAAGVQGSAIARTLGAGLDEQGRVKVRADLTVPGHPEIFVVGDLASLVQEGERVPGMAPAAIQEGRHAALNIRLALRGEPYREFHYRDVGVLATIGRAAAVAAIGRFRFSGLIAWVVWLVVHIAWLIGFRNRFVVLFEWAWAYFTYERSARVILDRPMTADWAQAAQGAAPRRGKATEDEQH